VFGLIKAADAKAASALLAIVADKPRIVSPEAFNRVTRVPVVLPITSGGGFARTAGFAVPLMGAGTTTHGIIRYDQPRALDLGARNARRLESAPEAVLDEVLARLAPIFE
jgi:mRNA-degrading endonuclease toxin of MazEF toxin-antitoxin module